MRNIIFENEAWIIVDKEPLVLTVPSRWGKEDPRRCLGIELQSYVGHDIFPIHRLDYEVSGLVVFAKKSMAQKKLSIAFADKKVQKTYQALTTAESWSHWPQHLKKELILKSDLVAGANFLWTCHLQRGKKRSFISPAGSVAITKAIFQGSQTTSSVLQWQLMPLTGRPHQLRFEMSRHGFPILGDSLYGSTENWITDSWSGGIALRAVELDFSQLDLADFMGLPSCLKVKKLFEI